MNDTKEIFEIIFDNAPDGIAIVNDMGRIVEWNPALEKMVEWREDEVKNKFVHDVLFRRKTSNNPLAIC